MLNYSKRRRIVGSKTLEIDITSVARKGYTPQLPSKDSKETEN